MTERKKLRRAWDRLDSSIKAVYGHDFERYAAHHERAHSSHDEPMDAEPDSGQPAPAVETTSAEVASDSELRNEWGANPGLREEFGDFETFRAYRQAHNAGNVKVLRASSNRKMLRPTDPEDPAFASKLIAQWKADAELRAEFCDDFDAYIAYAENEHNVRLLTG